MDISVLSILPQKTFQLRIFGFDHRQFSLKPYLACICTIRIASARPFDYIHATYDFMGKVHLSKFPAFSYMLGANLGLILYGEVLMIGSLGPSTTGKLSTEM